MRRLLFPLVLLLALGFGHSFTQIPRTLSYQGVLTNSSGDSTRPDNNYQFTFKLYNNSAVLWTETKTLYVKKGLFSTLLGDATAFPDSLKFDRQYLLGIQVGTEAELSPRIPLTSVGYSMNALRADTAKVVTQGGGLWNGNDTVTFRLQGNVGIGTISPYSKLHVNNPGNFGISQLRLENSSATGTVFDFSINRNDVPNAYLGSGNGTTSWLSLEATGRVGVGINTPSAKLHVKTTGNEVGLWVDQSSNNPNAYAAILKNGGGSGNGLAIEAGSPGSTSTLLWVGDWSGGNETMVVKGNHTVGINTSNPAYPLDVNGRTRTTILEITGGSDLAEPFPITGLLPAGTVVVIDENNSGYLVQSDQPYDKRVAGVVSGAGGIQPGLTLKQQGLMEGNQNIALSGRVYVCATAENGSIKPGDRLTTSDIPGHAMKATDDVRCPGAVIGKAMSALNEGTGLVLVLVNLQ